MAGSVARKHYDFVVSGYVPWYNQNKLNVFLLFVSVNHKQQKEFSWQKSRKELMLTDDFMFGAVHIANPELRKVLSELILRSDIIKIRRSPVNTSKMVSKPEVSGLISM